MQLHEKTILTVNGWYSKGHSCIHAWMLYASMHQCNCGSPRVLGITSYLQRIYKDSRDGELLPSFQGIFGTITFQFYLLWHNGGGKSYFNFSSQLALSLIVSKLKLKA